MEHLPIDFKENAVVSQKLHGVLDAWSAHGVTSMMKGSAPVEGERRGAGLQPAHCAK
jgi:hypothetical protein